MKKEYVYPVMNASQTRIRTSLLSGSTTEWNGVKSRITSSTKSADGVVDKTAEGSYVSEARSRSSLGF